MARRGLTPRRPTYLAGLLLAVVVLGGMLGAVGSAPLPRSPSHPSPVSAAQLDCNGASWNTTHLLVVASPCQAGFTVVYSQNLSQWYATGAYNFSFAMPWVAEITPSGDVVRIANAFDPFEGLANVSVGRGEVNLSSVETMNVTGASGNWTPNDTGYGSGPQWNISNRTLGTATLDVVFHLLNVTSTGSANATGNASYAVKFDVGVAGWPWANSTDLLGFGVDTLGAVGAHFAFNGSSRALDEDWNSTGRTFLSVVFGDLATVTYRSSLSAKATVAEQVGFFTAFSPARESVVLVTFGGVSGNYTSVSYDPWVVFSPGTVVSPPLPSLSPSGGIPSWTWVAAAVVALTAGLATIAVVVLRELHRHHEGQQLVDGMRRAISEAPQPPNRGA